MRENPYDPQGKRVNSRNGFVENIFHNVLPLLHRQFPKEDRAQYNATILPTENFIIVLYR